MPRLIRLREMVEEPLPFIPPRVELRTNLFVPENFRRVNLVFPRLVREPLPLPEFRPIFPEFPRRFPNPVREAPRRDPVVEEVPISPRAHLCRICNVDLANSGNEPIISHGGDRAQQHRVHRACMRRFYLENRSNRCCVAECWYNFDVDSFFTKAEQNSVTRKFLLRGSAVSAGLGAGLTMGGIFVLVLAFKVLVCVGETLDRLNKMGKYSGIKNYLEFCPLLSSVSVLIGGVTALAILASKVGSCFHKDRNPGKFEVEEVFWNIVITSVGGPGLMIMLNIRNLWVLPLSFGLVSGVLSGLFYAAKNSNVTFSELEDLRNI